MPDNIVQISISIYAVILYNMSISINTDCQLKCNPEQDIIHKSCSPKLSMSKMVFITNAIENGWTVKKKNGLYIFSKKHGNKKEVYMKNYLDNFIHSNLA